MATMLDKTLEGKEPRSMDPINAALRLKPGGVVVGEIRQADAVAALVEINGERPEPGFGGQE